MKIHQLLGGIPIAITNEEHTFIKSHDKNISLSALDEQGMWMAQNLVRKNVYKITNDNKHIVINSEHESNQPTI